MLKKNPLITVYITNYNYGNYIKKAINSVIFSSYTEGLYNNQQRLKEVIIYS